MQPSVHSLIRWGAAVGTAVMGVRRILYLAHPNFLPSRARIPGSTYARWTGVAVNSTTELLLLLILLGLPIGLYLSARVGQGRIWSSPFVIDVAFSVVLYSAACLLLPPR